MSKDKRGKVSTNQFKVDECRTIRYLGHIAPPDCPVFAGQEAELELRLCIQCCECT